MAFSDDERLLDFLRDRDVTCPACGYNLRDLQSQKCPECGRALKLAVGMAEPYLGAWIAMVIAWCLAAGIGLMLGCISLAHGPPPSREKAIVFAFIATIPFAVFSITRRRTILRWSTTAQDGTAIASALIVIGLFVWMIAFVWR